MAGEIAIPTNGKTLVRCAHLQPDVLTALHSAITTVNGELVTVLLCRDCASKGVAGSEGDAVLMAP